MGASLYTSLGGGGGRLPGPSSFQKCAGGLLSVREAPETGSWVIMVQSVSNQKDGQPWKGSCRVPPSPLLCFTEGPGRACLLRGLHFKKYPVMLCVQMNGRLPVGGSPGSLDACVALPEFKVARSSF